MAMTLDEMIERLTEIRDDFNVRGDTRIRGAFQPNYPLIANIAAITTVINCEEDDKIVYIAFTDGTQYGSSDLWEDDVVDRNEDEEDGE